MSLKFEQQNKLILKNFSACDTYFCKNLQLMTTKAHSRLQKLLDLGSSFRKGRSNTNDPACNEILDKVPDEIPL